MSESIFDRISKSFSSVSIFGFDHYACTYHLIKEAFYLLLKYLLVGNSM